MLEWSKTLFIEASEAQKVLGCSDAQMDAYISTGEIRRSPMHKRKRFVFTRDVLAIYQKQVPELEPNRLLGQHPGCGACLAACAVCKRIAGRVNSHLISDDEALMILDRAVGSELNTFLRVRGVRVDPTRKVHRISFEDVRKLRQQHVLNSIDVDHERQCIIGGLDAFIRARQQAQAEIDATLAQYMVGHEEPLFRFGRPVDLSEPPGNQYNVPARQRGGAWWR